MAYLDGSEMKSGVKMPSFVGDYTMDSEKPTRPRKIPMKIFKNAILFQLDLLILSFWQSLGTKFLFWNVCHAEISNLRKTKVQFSLLFI